MIQVREPSIGWNELFKGDLTSTLKDNSKALKPNRWLIVIEGLDGVGKSTLLDIIEKGLTNVKASPILDDKRYIDIPYPVRVVKNLGYNIETRKLKELINSRFITNNESLYHVFMAIWNIGKTTIKPATITIADRWIASTLTYQKLSTKEALSSIKSLNFKPGLTIHLTCDPKEAVNRITSGRAVGLDSQEVEVYDNYYEFSSMHTTNIFNSSRSVVHIDTSNKAPEEVATIVCESVEKYIRNLVERGTE